MSRNANVSYMMEPQTEKTANYTVVADTDCGKVFSSKLDGMVFTLPAISGGQVHMFVNTAEDETAKMSISPNASDGIMYVGSNTDDKDAINTKATQKKGDFIMLKSSEAGTVAWQVVASRGIWAKEA
jgi:hypothetical protein